MSTTVFVPVRFIETGATGRVPEANLAYFLARGYEVITEASLPNQPFPYVRSIAGRAGVVSTDDILAVLEGPFAAKIATGVTTPGEIRDGVDARVPAALVVPGPARDAVDGRIALAATGRTGVLCVVGDSITQQAGYAPSSPKLSSRGFWTWSWADLGCRFDVVNKGVAGNTSAQVLARMPDILATKADVYHLLIGTNDAGGLVSPPTAIATYNDILTQLLATGSKVIIGTLPPRTTYGAGVRTIHDAINDHIRRITHPNVQTVDYSAALSDPDTGAAQAGTLFDGLHPSALGAARMGKALTPALERVMALRSWLPDNNAEPTNRLTNGRFTNRTTGATTTGDVPVGWAQFGGSTEVAHTAVPRTGQPGSWWQIEKTAETVATYYGFQASLAALGLAVGDVIQFGIEYEFEGLNLAPTLNALPGIAVQDTNGTATPAIYNEDRFGWFALTIGTDPIATTGGSRKGAFRTIPHTIHASATAVRCLLAMPMTGKYRWDKAYVRKLN